MKNKDVVTQEDLDKVPVKQEPVKKEELTKQEIGNLYAACVRMAKLPEIDEENMVGWLAMAQKLKRMIK